jgi:uroporphyrinogen-III synthase
VKKARLAGRVIAITRPRGKNLELAEMLAADGAEVRFWPTIVTRAVSQPDLTWLKPLWQGHYNWLVFTSANTVSYFLQLAEQIDASNENLPAIAAVGKKTAKEVAAAGLRAEIVPRRHSAAELLRVFAEMQVAGMRFCLPGSNMAMQILPNGLKALGAQVDAPVIYNTQTNDEFNGSLIRKQIEAGEIDAILFYSPSAWEGFLQLTQCANGAEEWREGPALAAIGPTTYDKIVGCGYNVSIFPRRSDDDGMLMALREYFREKG